MNADFEKNLSVKDDSSICDENDGLKYLGSLIRFSGIASPWTTPDSYSECEEEFVEGLREMFPNKVVIAKRDAKKMAPIAVWQSGKLFVEWRHSTTEFEDEMTAIAARHFFHSLKAQERACLGSIINKIAMQHESDLHLQKSEEVFK